MQDFLDKILKFRAYSNRGQFDPKLDIQSYLDEYKSKLHKGGRFGKLRLSTTSFSKKIFRNSHIWAFYLEEKNSY